MSMLIICGLCNGKGKKTSTKFLFPVNSLCKNCDGRGKVKYTKDYIY